MNTLPSSTGIDAAKQQYVSLAEALRIAVQELGMSHLSTLDAARLDKVQINTVRIHLLAERGLKLEMDKPKETPPATPVQKVTASIRSHVYGHLEGPDIKI